jgi:ketosteroid isomerase-like protein
MKKSVGYSMITGILLLTGVLMQNNAKAQEWSAAQKEVWKGVNDYWAVMTKGDVNGFMEYFDNSYLGWEDNQPLPSTKAQSQKWLQFSTAGTKVLIYELKPVGIAVYNDVAVVHYYYTMVTEIDGKKKSESGRWTDVVKKEGNKWVLIGDNGGETKDKD